MWGSCWGWASHLLAVVHFVVLLSGTTGRRVSSWFAGSGLGLLIMGTKAAGLLAVHVGFGSWLADRVELELCLTLLAETD